MRRPLLIRQRVFAIWMPRTRARVLAIMEMRSPPKLPVLLPCPVSLIILSTCVVLNFHRIAHSHTHTTYLSYCILYHYPPLHEGEPGGSEAKCINEHGGGGGCVGSQSTTSFSCQTVVDIDGGVFFSSNTCNIKLFHQYLKLTHTIILTFCRCSSIISQEHISSRQQLYHPPSPSTNVSFHFGGSRTCNEVSSCHSKFTCLH